MQIDQVPVENHTPVILAFSATYIQIEKVQNFIFINSAVSLVSSIALLQEAKMLF